jgi:hypothetical protein
MILVPHLDGRESGQETSKKGSTAQGKINFRAVL